MKKIVSVFLALCMVISVLPVFQVASAVDSVESVKNRRTYYTDVKVANARANIEKHDWAAKIRDAAVEAAAPYVGKEEWLWNLVTTQELPRALHATARFNDTGETECLYCGKDLSGKYGSRPWKIDVINKPWKLQCPDCGVSFPSNDFGSFYELGIDEHANWDYELALQKHHEMFVCKNGGNCRCTPPADELPHAQWSPGEWRSENWKSYYGYGKGYLKNDAFDGKDEFYAVDDGWGYDYVDAATGENRIKPFIAYYNYHGIWGPYGKGIIFDALKTLSEAYIYTGEAKYGITGAVLVDRIADVYPDFDIKEIGYRFPVSDGGYSLNKDGKVTATPRGVIFGKLHDTDYAIEIVKAYDAFWPALSEVSAIAFLSEKAGKYGFENKKQNAASIAENIENKFIRQAHEWRILTKTDKDGNKVSASKYQGNFPMLQLMHILMGIVLDSPDEAKEWIDYELNAADDGVYVQLINLVDRDGHGNESAPGYNGSWITNFQLLADVLSGYDSSIDLYKNPKLIRMLTSQVDILCTSDTAPNIGDHDRMGRHLTGNKLETLITSYGIITDAKEKKNIARAIYEENGNTTDGLHGNIFEKNPEAIMAAVEVAVSESQALKLGSRNLTGYGLALLRDGNILSGKNTQRDFYIWYGDTGVSHSHRDKLTLGFHAYGLDVGADIGEPAVKTNTDPHRLEMTRQTISHNTVTVNNLSQRNTEYGTPLHFDAGERVQVMDVEAPEVYDWLGVEEYRRTLVMVDADDDISYGVDFFHISGGEDHLYSFHALGDTATLSDNVSVTSQTDSNGNYIGSYQGIDKGWGQSNINSIDLRNEYGGQYGIYDIDRDLGGTTDGLGTESWFGEVDRVVNPEDVDMFSMDWKIVDNDKVLKPAKDNLHVRLTMLNSFRLDEITATSGIPPQVSKAMKKVRFLFARRTAEKGETLDTLFTSVIEPYDTDRYISSIEKVNVSRADGADFTTDEAKAVKVTLTNGRVDYIVYAKDNSVSYIVDEGEQSFEFCGFVGVISREGGVITYTYINDGKAAGNNEYIASEYTGSVKDFTTGLNTVNCIDIIIPDTPVSPESLKGRYVYINNDGVSDDNAVYRIESATQEDGFIRLYIGNTTLITSYKDNSLLESGGFNYNIKAGNSVSIPVAYEQNVSDRFGSNSGFVRTVNDNGECELTLLAGIDGAEEYNAVGFEITALGVKKNSRGKDVYGKVTALDQNKEKITLMPSQFGENSKYIFSGAFLFGAEYNGYGLMYRPFAIDLNGNWLYGENRVLSRIFGNGEVE